MTYRECYEKGRAALEAMTPQNEDASLDAKLLLEAVCGTDRETLLAYGDERVVSDDEAERYSEFVTQRADHEPVAYILGEQYFMGLKFKVTHDVLIPEQDTETLVEEAMKEVHDGFRILDLCTGSGCILLSLLHYSNECSGVGTDISEEALLVAKQNAALLGLSGKSSFLNGDMYAAFDDNDDDGRSEDRVALPDGRFQLVVSNPPYIRENVIETLAPEVKSAEPYGALCGGNDGLEFYRIILGGISSVLVTGGVLIMEIGYDQGGDVSSMMKDAGFIDVRVIKDYGGNDRVVRGELK